MSIRIKRVRKGGLLLWEMINWFSWSGQHQNSGDIAHLLFFLLIICIRWNCSQCYSPALGVQCPALRATAASAVSCSESYCSQLREFSGGSLLAGAGSWGLPTLHLSPHAWGSHLTRHHWEKTVTSWREILVLEWDACKLRPGFNIRFNSLRKCEGSFFMRYFLFPGDLFHSNPFIYWMTKALGTRFRKVSSYLTRSVESDQICHLSYNIHIWMMGGVIK